MDEDRKPMANITPFGLRMQPAMKARVEAAAQENNRSLNAEIVSRLQQSFDSTHAMGEVERRKLAIDLLNASKRIQVFFVDDATWRIEVIKGLKSAYERLRAISSTTATPEDLITAYHEMSNILEHLSAEFAERRLPSSMDDLSSTLFETAKRISESDLEAGDT